MSDESVEIEITSELQAYLGERRQMYMKFYPNMTQKERVDLLQQDLIEEHFRRKGETVHVSVD